MLVMALILAAGGHAIEAQTLKFTVAQTANANGSVTPALTWCTEGATASPGSTCSSTGAAAACIASGDWSGTKAPAGSETLAAVTSGKNYQLQCNWSGDDKITLTWSPPTKNDDGSPLTDLAGFHVYYGTSPSMSNNQVKDVKGATTTQTVLGPGLAPGTWYVVMDAYNANGALSTKAPAPPASKVLGTGVVVSQSVKVTFPQAPVITGIQ